MYVRTESYEGEMPSQALPPALVPDAHIIQFLNYTHDRLMVLVAAVGFSNR